MSQNLDFEKFMSEKIHLRFYVMFPQKFVNCQNNIEGEVDKFLSYNARLENYLI